MAKRKAEEALPSKSLSAKKRTDTERQLATTGISDEQAFRQKYAEDFDLQPTGIIQVKQEPRDDTSPRPSSRSSEENQDSRSGFADNASKTSPNGPSVVDNSSSAPRGVPEDTLHEILGASRDVEWAQIAIGSVLQHACTTATSGDELGITHIRAFVSRLAERLVEDAWLAEVIGLIQQRLESTCDRIQSQIHSLGKARSIKASTAHSNQAVQQAQGDQSLGKTASKVSTPPSRTNEMPLSERTATSAPQVADDRRTPNGEAHNSETDGGYETTISQHEIEAPTNDQRTASNKVLSTWQPNAGQAPYYASRSPLQKPFDLFARSAIDAHHFDPKEALDVIERYRRSARSIWKSISSKQKSGWKKVFQVRASAKNMSIKGQKLLKSQGLLGAFLPEHQSSSASLSIDAASSTSVAQEPPDDVSTRTSDVPDSATEKTLVSILLPELVPVTSTTPITQPCFVPFAARAKGIRGEKDRRGLFIINTPDIRTKATVSDADIRACAQGLKLRKLVRRNHNVFTATFPKQVSPSELEKLGVILPPEITLDINTLGVPAELHWCRPPLSLVCDATGLDLNHTTVAERICNEYLRGTTLSYELFRQGSPQGNTAQVHYILRFAGEGPEPWVQRLYFPLDAQSGGQRKWAVFGPSLISIKCMFCGNNCQMRYQEQQCPFEKKIGGNGGPVT